MIARKNNAMLTPWVDGTGNDKLWGDKQAEADLSGQYHGSDYLDGGAVDEWRIAA